MNHEEHEGHEGHEGHGAAEAETNGYECGASTEVCTVGLAVGYWLCQRRKFVHAVIIAIVSSRKGTKVARVSTRGRPISSSVQIPLNRPVNRNSQEPCT